MDNGLLYRSALLGGITAALFDALPFINFINCLCCLGIAAGGITAVFYYRVYSEDANESLSMPEIIQLGLMSGIIGALFSFTFQYIVFLIMGNWQIEMLKNLMDNMDEIPAVWADLYDQLQNTEELQTFAGFAVLIRSLIIFPIFTFIGALLTNKIMDKKSMN
jgi:hypothetical protein